VEKVIEEGVSGLVWNGQRYQDECSIPNRNLMEYNFRSRHFLGQYSFDYESPLKLLFLEKICTPRVNIFRDKLGQRIFNSKTPVRTSRIELLKKIIDYQFENKNNPDRVYGNSDNGITSFEIIDRMYSYRIYDHPDYERMKFDLEMNLEALVDSGDLIEIRRDYKVSVTCPP